MNTLLSDSLETEPIKIYIYTFFIKKYEKNKLQKEEKVPGSVTGFSWGLDPYADPRIRISWKQKNS